MDLTEHNHLNLRNLQELDNLNNIPIPLCLFNLTDNNVITSMTCPESLSDSKKQYMILDLYFFRPPAIKRLDKEVKLGITEEKNSNRKYIREKNKGICDVHNSVFSFCTTEMNTTTDLNNNLLAYDEIAFENITMDSNNTYIKNKTTNLIDITSEFKSDPEKYNDTLNKFLSKLNPYMKYHEHFSREQFKELYSISKGLPINQRRRNEEKKQYIINNLKYFEYKNYGGVDLNIFQQNNLGYNTEAMEASQFITIDDNNENIVDLKTYYSIDKIINKLKYLSQAGNILADILRNNVEVNCFDASQAIKNNITVLNKKLAYKNISELFDPRSYLEYVSTLPLKLVEDSNELVNKLENVLNGIKNGNLKANINILNKNINNYNKESHILINKIFNDLKELSEALNKKKNKLTEISTYYSGQSNTSYLSTILQAENILMNYYKKENDTINSKVASLLNKFEEEFKNSLNKEIDSVNEIYSNLINKTMEIENASNEDYNMIIDNLKKINDYIYKIINEIRNQIGKEIGIKEDSNYTISLYDIESNKNESIKLIKNAKEIAIKLDNDQFIDKKFDEIMTKFREKFSEIKTNMDSYKLQFFPLNERLLQDNFFTSSDEKNITNELKNLRAAIILHVKNENDEFLSSVNEKIDNYLLENKDILIQLINSITISLSEKFFEKLSDLYEIAFNNCLNRIGNETKYNKHLAENYFMDLKSIILNNSKILDLIEDYDPVDKSLYSDMLPHGPNGIYTWSYTNFSDSISETKKTQNYLNKYDGFNDKFKKSISYLYSQLYTELYDKYKDSITKTKEILQSIKNNKISDKFPNYNQLDFIEDNIKDIDELYIRLDKYLSDDIFNENYNQRIMDFKSSQISIINNITDNIKNEHNLINTQNTVDDYIHDFCFSYVRTKAYTCTNKVVSYKTSSGDYCLPSNNSDNYINIKIPSIESDIKMEEYKKIFNDSYSLIKEKADMYNSKINDLRNIILSTEKEIINRQRDSDYLFPLQNTINNILSKKYGDKLINGTYSYYQKNMDKNIQLLFNNISNEWTNSFNEFKNDVEININEIKHSSNAFGLMALLYENIITSNITKSLYNSIENHQKNEFNYTISYLYNFLSKEVNLAYQYIMNEIPINEGEFNNIINQRKNEINNIFNILTKNITNSKNKALSMNNQNNVLGVSINNFFNLNNKLVQFIKETSDSLKNIAMNIFMISNNKSNDEYSLACEYYLENIESGKQINKFYEPTYEDLFVELNSINFKNLLLKNIKFDQKQFMINLNTSIYNSNKAILKLYSVEKNTIEKTLEKEITQYFDKENFYAHIDSLYENEIKLFDNQKISQINKIVEEMINVIKENLFNETREIIENANSFTSDFSKINKTIDNYKEKIYNKTKLVVIKIIENLYEDIVENTYNKNIKEKLNFYLETAKNYSMIDEEYNLINYSFKIRKIIFEIVNNLVGKYINITKESIESINKDYISTIYDNIQLDSIKELINNEIDNEYNSKLFKALQNYAIYNPGDKGYSDYDFNEKIKDDIDSAIESYINDIYNIMLSTKGDDDFKGILNLVNVDFSLVELTFNKIIENFKLFINPQIEKQKNEIDSILIKIIKSNFNNTLNNIILTFGNDYFERIIKYNENYKIISLYENLKHSLVISLQYYVTLYGFKEVESLTKDLKLKLFNLNNLDLRAKAENENILKLLNNKIDKFIEDLKIEIVNNYISYMEENNTYLDSNFNFNDDIKKKIVDNLGKATIEIQNDFESLLNKLFKEKLIASYTDIMNLKTKEMIDVVKTQKEYIKSAIDDFLSLDTENILNDINDKLIKTTNSINQFNEHLPQFNISDQLGIFLNKIGENNIQPLFAKFTSTISEKTQEQIITHLSLKIQEIEQNFNSDEILDISNNLYSNLNNHFNNMNNSINEYGISEYNNNLENKINEIEQKNKRRLNNEQKDDNFRVFPDSALDKSFRKLLDSLKNMKIFVNSYEKFEDFEKKLSTNILNLNISYDSSKNSIINNFDMDSNILFNKLDYVRNIILLYYNRVNTSYYSLKNYLFESINEIDILLNKCANITYEVFTRKYEEISNEAELIEEEFNELENEKEIENTTSISQNGKFITSVQIEKIKKSAKIEFRLIFEEEGNIKKPRVIAGITNLNKPEKVTFKINSNYGTCGAIIEEIILYPNNINYTTYIDFNTDSTYIIENITANFATYTFSTEKYEIKDAPGKICNKIMDVIFCVDKSLCNERIQLEELKPNIVESKIINKTINI